MQNFWIIFGFAGQAVFGGAFILQWIASEKRKRSHVPISFWYLRAVGSVMLLVLACNMLYEETWKALPLVFGFSLNILIYGRNLMLIYRRRSAFASVLGEKNADTEDGAC
ncbi:MAG TPA: lipid-A-disaccharide synthase N-terminal domain-containing protein [Planctomycetota bacterium]|nr:lipid-A-disaccharide synthase N-terminal domain-containing protein [Planctomycetota bacterium]